MILQLNGENLQLNGEDLILNADEEEIPVLRFRYRKI